MPNIKVDGNDWMRNGTFIKTLIEFIQEGRKDETIIKLIEHIKTSDYAEAEKLADKDIFLLYCKLLAAGRQTIIQTLRLIEDLVELSDDYSYQTTHALLFEFPITFPLLAYCILNEVDWKEIAYIQQHRKIKHETGVRIGLEANLWNSANYDKFDIAREKFDSKFVELYKPYLILGDAYVDFINNRDDWNEKIKATYVNHPQEVIEYLGW